MNDTPRRRRGSLPGSEDELAEVAVRYLERFPTTSARLVVFLRRKIGQSVAEDVCSQADGEVWVSAVVRRMVNARLLDDRQWAESRARVLHRRGRALRVIRRDLLAHGLGPELTSAGLEALAEQHEDVELTAARALARRRRLGPFAAPDKRGPQREKHLAVLARAGFSFAIARRVIDASETTL